MWIFAAAMGLMLQSAPWLAMPMPEGFVTAHQQTAQMGSIEERILKGETVERWTRMVTLLTINLDMPAESYAAQFDQRLMQGCPGARPVKRAAAKIGSETGVDGWLACPRNPATGLPETLRYRVVRADGRLYMAQVAFRSVPDADGVRWADAQINAAMLCVTGSTDALCQR